MAKSSQIKLLKDSPKAYGGELLKTRKGRSQARPLSVSQSIHMVLYSSHAKNEFSFLKPKNKTAIREILKKFSSKYGVKILSGANVGNHLHMHIKLSNRYAYKPFIRSITAAIATSVMGLSRWKTKKDLNIKRFWDYRPFTRVIIGFRSILNLNNYIEINKLEGKGVNRKFATQIVHAKLQPLGP